MFTRQTVLIRSALGLPDPPALTESTSETYKERSEAHCRKLM